MNYEKMVGRLRQRIFIYEDESPEKGEKCAHALRRALQHQAKQDKPRQRQIEKDRQDRFMRTME